MFINVPPYQKVCTCRWNRKYLVHCFISVAFFLGQPQYAYGFSTYSLIWCLQSSWNSRIHVSICLTFNILYAFTLRYFFRRYKTFAIFLVKMYYFLMVHFFLICFGNLDLFSHVVIFTIRVNLIKFRCIKFHKIFESLERNYGIGSRFFSYFLDKRYN